MKLYYMTYKVYESNTEGELYVADTGFGFLELGVIERDRIYEEIRFSEGLSIEEFIEKQHSTIIDYVRVL